MPTNHPPTREMTRDITFEIGEFAGNPAITALREQKPQIFEQIQGYYDSTVEPAEPSSVSLAERALIAQRVAAGIPSPLLADWYQRRIDAQDAVDESTPRIVAILARIALVNTSPDRSTPEDLRALRDARLSQTEIISISQLIAFVHYQARLLAGLRALGAHS